MIGDMMKTRQIVTERSEYRAGWSLYRWIGVCAMLTLAALMLLSLAF